VPPPRTFHLASRRPLSDSFNRGAGFSGYSIFLSVKYPCLCRCRFHPRLCPHKSPQLVLSMFGLSATLGAEGLSVLPPMFFDSYQHHLGNSTCSTSPSLTQPTTISTCRARTSFLLDRHERTDERTPVHARVSPAFCCCPATARRNNRNESTSAGATQYGER